MTGLFPVAPLWPEMADVWVYNLYQCNYAINLIKLLTFSQVIFPRSVHIAMDT